MAKYKVLRSVAHNTAASFTSLMNYADDDYVMGKLLTHARATGQTSYVIDFVSGVRSQVFEAYPLDRVASFYTKMFWDNVKKQGSDRSVVTVGRLDLKFNTSVSKPTGGGRYLESPYTCVVHLLDNRGVDHSKKLTGWWFPEPYDGPRGFRKLILRLKRNLGF